MFRIRGGTDTIVSAVSIVLVTVVLWPVPLKASDPVTADLTSLSLEQLMEIKVTSAARRPQKVFHVPAAIFVITQEDIRRSGVTTVPEALRMVPGVEVSRIDANKWAITCRGFNGRFANKLLVMIDGRTVYTPLFSGVFWDVQDTFLEDIDRIEVIRGPGASLWGANAVNGIINIITKEAKDTQGLEFVTGFGTEEHGFGSIRYGGKLGDDAHWRVYASYFDRDGFVNSSGSATPDDWDVLRSGFRMDWEPSGRDMLTLQGDTYTGDIGERFVLPSLVPPYSLTPKDDSDVFGGNILGRWIHTLSDSSDMALQVYYDRTNRRNLMYGESRDTLDIDFQHRFTLGSRQEIVWGLGYRFSADELDSTSYMALNPASRGLHLFSAFVQDGVVLVKDRLHVTVGSKFEHNDFTGLEVQPTARALWTPHEHHTVWAAVSRAVRTPSRAEEDVVSPNSVIPPNPMIPLPTLITLFGNPRAESEKLLAYELGYRFQPWGRISLDIAGFYNDYDNLGTLELLQPFPIPAPPGIPTHFVQPVTRGYKMDGTTYGVELAADWPVLDWWRLQASYTYLQMELSLDADSTDMASTSAEGQNPHHQVSLRSTLDLPANLGFDLWVRYVDGLPALRVERYVTLDARLGWRPLEQIEFSVVGQNLIEAHHLEYIPELLNSLPVEVERSVYGKITCRF